MRPPVVLPHEPGLRIQQVGLPHEATADPPDADVDQGVGSSARCQATRSRLSCGDLARGLTSRAPREPGRRRPSPCEWRRRRPGPHGRALRRGTSRPATPRRRPRTSTTGPGRRRCGPLTSPAPSVARRRRRGSTRIGGTGPRVPEGRTPRAGSTTVTGNGSPARDSPSTHVTPCNQAAAQPPITDPSLRAAAAAKTRSSGSRAPGGSQSRTPREGLAHSPESTYLLANPLACMAGTSHACDVLGSKADPASASSALTRAGWTETNPLCWPHPQAHRRRGASRHHPQAPKHPQTGAVCTRRARVLYVRHRFAEGVSR